MLLEVEGYQRRGVDGVRRPAFGVKEVRLAGQIIAVAARDGSELIRDSAGRALLDAYIKTSPGLRSPSDSMTASEVVRLHPMCRARAAVLLAKKPSCLPAEGAACSGART